VPVEDAANIALFGVCGRDEDSLAKTYDQDNDCEGEPHQAKNQGGALGLNSFLHNAILARGGAGRRDYHHKRVRYSAFSKVSNNNKQTVVNTTS